VKHSIGEAHFARLDVAVWMVNSEREERNASSLAVFKLPGFPVHFCQVFCKAFLSRAFFPKVPGFDKHRLTKVVHLSFTGKPPPRTWLLKPLFEGLKKACSLQFAISRTFENCSLQITGCRRISTPTTTAPRIVLDSIGEMANRNALPPAGIIFARNGRAGCARVRID